VYLAHTLGEGGPEIEFLIVGAAMLVLGIVFFIQKSTKPAVPVVLVLGAFAMVAGAFVAGGSQDEVSGSAGSAGEASLEIVFPGEGETVAAGEPVQVNIEVTGAPEGGHFDVRVDGEIATMTPETDPEVVFPKGESRLSVEYVNVQHQSFDPPITAEISVTAE
jgi:hypothetical protein